ncbi:MAG: acetoacetate decarboxylase family protein [Spirochaetaceae bacterium]
MPDAFVPKRHAPAPWLLKGRAFGVLAVLRKGGYAALRSTGPASSTRMRPRVVLLCAVEYTDSPVGPYSEVFSLVAPAEGGLNRAEVTHMHVDSEESTYWGRRNWAVPKQTSDIDLKWRADRISADLTVAGEPACRIELSPPGRFGAFPVILPAGIVRITQPATGHRILTGLSGFGRVSLCRNGTVETLSDAMPSRSLFFPIAGFVVHRFTFTMETPTTSRHTDRYAGAVR